MLIVCPACTSEYQIDIDRVGPNGRSVRCAACRETWFIAPEEVAAAREAETAAIMEEIGLSAPADSGPIADAWAEAAQDEERQDEAAPAIIDQPSPPRRAATAPSKKSRFALATAWPALAAGLAIIALVPLALIGRASVVRAMPQSAGLFAAVGLPVNLRGIELRDVVAFQTQTEGQAPVQLSVEGDLVSVANENVAVPPIEIEIRDADDRPLAVRKAPPPRATLEPGDKARFHADLSASPPQGRRVLVRFAAPAPDHDAGQAPAEPHGAAPAH